jgi:TonB-linked SusC/RagA family outer membrane protein
MPTIQNTLANPLMQLESRWDKTRDNRNRVVGSIYAEISFLKNFTLRGSLYTDYSIQNRRIYTPIIQGYNPEVSGGASPIINITQLTNVTEDREEIRRYQQDYILSYKKNFGEHSFTGTAGFTTYYDGFFKLSGEVKQKNGADPIPDNERFWYISNGFGDVSTQRSSSDQREATTVSGLARVLYNFKGKYFLNGSFRRDGSSLIYNPDTRSQNFWAVGAAWDLTKEKFMEGLAFFNVLKIKGSIGVLGNQNTYGTSYPYFPTISAGNTAVFGNSVFPSYSNNYLVSRNLKWETVHGKEIGIEMNALNNRLYGEINYYRKNTEDMLAYLRPIGVLPTLGNLGAIKNQGIEIMSRWTQNLTNDWSYSISANLTTYNNEVTELATPLPADEQYPNQTLVGEPIGYFYGYIVDGIVQSYADKLKSPKFTEFAYGPGDFKYRDLNNDGIIDAKDKTRIGNPTPDFTYGGTVNVTFRNIDLSVEVNGVYGNEIYRYWNTSENLFSVYSYPKYLLNRWHGEGTSNWVPIIDQTHKVNRVASTYGIEDGSYFRIRNLQIGYNFKQNTLSKAYIKNARVFFNVQNLKTWRRNLGYSPEFGGTNTNGQAATSFGIDLGNANSAIPQVFTGGINITF